MHRIQLMGKVATPMSLARVKVCLASVIAERERAGPVAVV